MINKRIIIDNVNVSGCKCYNPNIKMDCLMFPLQPDVCKNNPNCHYKLYKRKEQECQDLRNLISTFGATGICEVCTDKSVLISDEYTKVIKQIKEIAQWAVKSPMSSATEITKFEGILKTIELAEKRIDEAKNNSKYFKLKQNLEEIKEIVEQGVKIHDDIIVSKQILQKIKECEM